MTFVKTLKLNNGSELAGQSSLATPSIQIQSSDKETSNTVPDYQQVPATSVYIPEIGQFSKDVLTLDNLSKWIWTPPPQPQALVSFPSLEPYFGEVIIPPFNGGSNLIIPTYILPGSSIVVQDNVLSDIHQQFGTNQLFSIPTKRFETYEQLTGISHDRPEIVMLTNFLPLFDNVANANPTFINQIEDSGINPYMTDAGRFIDTYLQSRNLRYVDIVNMLRNLRVTYPYAKLAFRQQRQYLERGLTSVRTNAAFLMDLVRNIDQMKSQLDLRHNIHTVNPRNVMKKYLFGFDTSSTTSLENLISNYLPEKYTLSDVLVRLGYNPKNVDVYTSTKLWIQVLLELRDIMRYHSFEFIDMEPVTQRSDSNASTINRTNWYTPYFGSSFNSPVPSISQINKLEPTQVVETIDILSRAWYQTYQIGQFKNREARIAGLANAISKEFRYSVGLSSEEVQRTLSEQFGYQVQPTGNAAMFNSIIGNIGYNITYFSGKQTNSLTNLAQRQIDDVSILTFESKFIDGYSGTSLPGGSYYIDHALKTDGQKFDTSRLEEIGKIFDKVYKSFSTVVNGLNIMAPPVLGDSKSRFTSTLSNPIDFIQDFARNIIDVNTGNTLPAIFKDRLATVYSFAATNDRVKSALFLYTISRIFRSKTSTSVFVAGDNIDNSTRDNSAFNSELIKYIADTIEASTVQMVRIVEHKNDTAGYDETLNYPYPTLTSETISSALKSGTTLTKTFELMMTQVLTALHFQDQALANGSNTRMSGYLDTGFLMLVFEACLQLTSIYVGQVIDSIAYGSTQFSNGELTYNIGITSTNWRSSFNDIVTRLEKEVALTHQIVYSVLNTLQSLSESFKNGVNYLNSQVMLDKLREISVILKNPNMLNMLMSEQQIMIISSTAQDMLDRLAQQSVITDNSDVDGDGVFDAEDEIKLLDDSIITPKLRDAVYGLFGSPEFVSKKGNNKKFLTVGIPQGFITRLKQRVSLNSLNRPKNRSQKNKQSDIIGIVVYKIDVQNPDIVFKSKRLLFEMSRFPVRNEKLFLKIPQQPSAADIFRAIPTRDFSQGLSSEPSYWSDGSKQIDRDLRVTFSDDSYSFLSSREKSEIICNHVTSYLTDEYVRMMTGVNIADDQFNMTDLSRSMNNDTVRLITEHYIDFVVNSLSSQQSSSDSPSDGVLFSSTSARKSKFSSGDQSYNMHLDPSGIAGFVSQIGQFNSIKGTSGNDGTEAKSTIGDLATNLKLVTARNIPVVTHGLRVISNLSHMTTTLSDPGSIQQRILSPKQFDRVFNIIIDTNDFEVDQQLMAESPQGLEAFNQLFIAGNVLPMACTFESSFGCYGATFDQYTSPIGQASAIGSAGNQMPSFQLPNRSKVQGDLIMDKYFVTIETLGEE
jgi:hypothetical protein